MRCLVVCLLAILAHGEEPQPQALIIDADPADDLYPRYLADPYRPRHVISYMHAATTEIPDSGASRIAVGIGDRFHIIRRHRPGEPLSGVQLDFEGSILAQFDLTRGWDNIGWDGRYAIQLAAAPLPWLRLQIGLRHVSAHRGDEYVLRTGSRRINYTREDIHVGAAVVPDPRFAAYLDIGYAVHLGSLESERAMVQSGLQFDTASAAGGTGWYGGIDLQAFEENELRPMTSLHFGAVLMQVSGRRWRTGIELLEGRSPMGEFSQLRERSVSLGITVEL